MNTELHEMFFLKGAQLLSKAGYTVSLGSICEPEFVLVFSHELVPNTYGHPKAEYLVTVHDGQFVEQISSNLR